MQKLATELKELNVIVAVPSYPVAFAAKFFTGVDPVKLGLVQSINKLRGNLTGIALQANELMPKRMELLHELSPDLALIAVLANPSLEGRADKRRG